MPHDKPDAARRPGESPLAWAEGSSGPASPDATPREIRTIRGCLFALLILAIALIGWAVAIASGGFATIGNIQ